jgi:hypothetical protein
LAPVNDKGAWLPAFSAQELTQAVHDNLRNLQLACWTW